MKDTLWHTISKESTLKNLNASLFGLSSEEVKTRIQKRGFNVLLSKNIPSSYHHIAQHLCNPLYIILFIVGCIKWTMGEPLEGCAIWFVIFFNIALGLFQEWKSQKALDSLTSFLAPTARVLRDGEEIVVDATHLVPGDIIFLSSGMKVPADARLLEAFHLEADESSLTGESFSVSKEAISCVEEKTPLSERSNMIYQGTTILQGRAKACVVATGMKTEFGKMCGSLTTLIPEKPPLQKRLEKFSKQLTLVILSLMLLLIGIGCVQGYSLYDLLMTSLSLAVSAIPEGLPIAMTVALSYGLYQMAKRNAIIRKLSAVEALGCTTIVCTDKTGTLTQNNMRAESLLVGAVQERCEVLLQTLSQKTKTLLKQSVIFSSDPIFSSPIEQALLKMVEAIPLPNQSVTPTLVLPFESNNGKMMSQTTEEGKSFLWCKGSPEKIAEICSKQLTPDGQEILFDKQAFLDSLETLAAHGYRSLSLAVRAIEEDERQEENFTMIGTVGFIDPPREQAKSAVQTCQRAGIRVYMITGDHPKTAGALAQKVDLIHSPEEVLLGPSIDGMKDKELLDTLETHFIIARATPLHKLRIVSLLQKEGHIVAMTGDGVNDSPSLKQANIGIAMGSSVDVAKEASSMVVLDDNFSTIVEALRYGRTIYKNIQHMILYSLTTCFGGVLTITASILLKLPLPLIPLQLLWMNLITDGSTIVPIAFEKEHGDSMDGTPRQQKESLITMAMWKRTAITSLWMCIGTVSLFSWSLFCAHTSLEKSRTFAFTTLCFFQIANGFNARSLYRSLFFTLSHRGKNSSPIQASDNPLFIWVVAIGALLQVLVVQLPFCNTLLHTTPLTVSEWFTTLIVSFSVIPLVEIQKFVGKK